MKKKIYVAGPYSKGDTAVNVRNAYVIAEELVKLECAPYVPHATHFWHLIFPHEYEFWLKLDLEYLPICDAIYRFPGESNGADDEVKEAQRLGMKVLYSMDDVKQYLEESK